MKLIKEIVIHLIILLKKIKYSFFKPSHKKFIHKDVTFYSQWESPELVDKILKGEISAEDDPQWKNSGAKDKTGYLFWTWHLCGTACLKMILTYLNKKQYKLIELAKGIEKYGGYKQNERAFKAGDYKKAYDGLFYKPFVEYLQREQGIDSQIVLPMIQEEIIAALDQNKFVIASVSPLIRRPSDIPAYTGGHLVLMLGYDLSKKIFWLHNPSGYFKNSQDYAEITFADFEKFFDFKGIVINK